MTFMCRRSIAHAAGSLLGPGIGYLTLLGVSMDEPVFAQTSSGETGMEDVALSQPLRDLSTDRPDKTESPYTVDAGHFQLEMDFANYTSDRTTEDGILLYAEKLGMAPINLKYGIGPDADLQLIVQPYIRTSTTDQLTGVSDIAEGFGDVTIRFKQNLFGNDDGAAALALMPFIDLPAGSRGISSGFIQGGLVLPLAIPLGSGVNLGFMTEVDLSADASGHYAPSFVNSATLGFELDDRLSLYVEGYTQRNVASDAPWIVTLDTGVTYALSPNLQFDIGVNVAASKAADDLSLFFGMSRRF